MDPSKNTPPHSLFHSRSHTRAAPKSQWTELAVNHWASTNSRAESTDAWEGKNLLIRQSRRLESRSAQHLGADQDKVPSY